MPLNKINGLERRSEADPELRCHRTGSILTLLGSPWQPTLHFYPRPEDVLLLGALNWKPVHKNNSSSFECEIGAAEPLNPSLNGCEKSGFIFVPSSSSRPFHAHPLTRKCHCARRRDDISLRLCRMTFDKTRSCSTSW